MTVIFALFNSYICIIKQLNVVAVDGGGRRSSATAVISITVRRNQFPPIFIDSTTTYPYAVTVEYTKAVTSTVVNVKAEDVRDSFNVVKYRLGTAYGQYFSIDTDTGVITLTGDLSNAAVSSVTRFNVRNHISIFHIKLCTMKMK